MRRAYCGQSSASKQTAHLFSSFATNKLSLLHGDFGAHISRPHAAAVDKETQRLCLSHAAHSAHAGGRIHSEYIVGDISRAIPWAFLGYAGEQSPKFKPSTLGVMGESLTFSDRQLGATAFCLLTLDTIVEMSHMVIWKWLASSTFMLVANVQCK